MRRYFTKSIFCLLALCPIVVQGETPYWIWKDKGQDSERANFRTYLNLEEDPEEAFLRMTCDNSYILNVNGKRVASSEDWKKPLRINLSQILEKGKNYIYIEAQNEGAAAGMVFDLTVDGKKMVSNKGWQAQAHEGEWKKAVEIQSYGGDPWGNILEHAEPYKREIEPEATELDNIQSLSGFSVEKLYTTRRGEGSWVGLCSDQKGRLITVDQHSGIYRVTLTPEVSVERLQVGLKGAWGALCAFDSLYLFLNEGPEEKRGLYRLQDTTQDDQYDKVEHIIPMKTHGEHGVHSILLSPDKKSLHLIVGNYGVIPSTVTHHRLSTKWGEDHLLPRMQDGRGHNVNGMAPGGFIMKVSPDGKEQEVVCIGFRNQVDAAFNEDGELFTFDSDLEYDIGSPWYRPTRIIHVVSGADWGWRAGSGKWPTYYTDSLPATLNIGPGSPTGMCSGAGSSFPAKYQKALFAADWTYGTLYAIHLERNGATYQATKEEFLSGKPLPLTDQLIHTDGNMYLLTGGRRTTSSLYKVSYTGTENTEKIPAAPALSEDLLLRRKLEALHEPEVSVEAVPLALEYIGHEDRFIRHAARTALELQPTEHWKNTLQEKLDPWELIEITTALARVGDQTDQEALLEALNTLPLETLPPATLLAALRSYQLAFTRHGKPTLKNRESVISKLNPLYPHADNYVTRELAQILLYLNAPEAVSKTVDQVLNATHVPEKIHSDDMIQRNEYYGKSVSLTEQFQPNVQQYALAFSLHSIKKGWTREDYYQYFSWFRKAETWQGGNSYQPYIDRIRRTALRNVYNRSVRNQCYKLSHQPSSSTRQFTPPKGPGRAWTVEDAVRAVEGHLVERDYQNGKNLFHATSCGTCHTFGREKAGLGIGPNLTGSASRYSIRDMMENIIHPSKSISDQYGSTKFRLKDGTIIIGRSGTERNGAVRVLTDPFSIESAISVKLSDVLEQNPYAVSPMPAGLINTLNPEELRDLIAYLFSGGDPKHEYFQE